MRNPMAGSMARLRESYEDGINAVRLLDRPI
jgi:hypothetical protein